MDTDCRMVVQISANSREIELCLDAELAQLTGGTDAGPEQNQRRPIGATGEDDAIRADVCRARRTYDVHAGNPGAIEGQAVGKGVPGDAEIRQVSNRIEVGEGAVPAYLRRGIDVDRANGEPELGIETAQIGDEGVVSLVRCVEHALMKGRQVLASRDVDSELPIDLAEQGLDLGRTPAGIVHGPDVVVRAVTPDGGTPVV